MTATGQPAVPVRLIFSYDLFGAFAPFPTSYGRLPGARALEAHVDRLREGARVARWIDGGDFSAGGVLAPATDNEFGWRAAGDLRIDAGVPGNHDFDFGDEVFDQRERELPFPLFAIDLPGRDQPMIVESPGGPTVAVLGVCFPERRGRRVYTRDPDHQGAVARITATARGLRGDVDRVVVVMHDGLPGTAVPPTRSPAAQLCAAVADEVAAVFGAHTMARHVGELGGVQYQQPWPLGSEVAVLDVFDDHLESWLSPVTGHREWDGPGADLLAELHADIVGENQLDLYSPRRGDSGSISAATAEGLRSAVDADIALVTVGDTSWMQPPLDGFGGYLPTGPVSRAQVLRALPFTTGHDGGSVWVADLDSRQLETLVTACAARFGALDIARRHGRADGTTALSSTRIELAREVLGDDVDWSPSPLGLRDGLIRWLQDSRPHTALRGAS